MGLRNWKPTLADKQLPTVTPEGETKAATNLMLVDQ